MASLALRVEIGFARRLGRYRAWAGVVMRVRLSLRRLRMRPELDKLRVRDL